MSSANSWADSLTPEAIGETIKRMGLIPLGEQCICEPLSGGVSSDIWRITVDSKRYCLKRALPRLKVAQLWEAPVGRNRFEWQWFRTVGAISPGSVPNLVAHDQQAGLFVMDYLDPKDHPPWKSQLRDGLIHEGTAERVAERLVKIHAATANNNAECAWYGDPAFDPAFCLNHLLLKCLWRPQYSKAFLACFDRFAVTYLKGVSWEAPASIESRIAHLLPALFLARVDGKSTIEYVTTERDKNRVRDIARPLILCPTDELRDIRRAWAREVISI